MPGTVRFQRVLKAPPERVYKAFLDAEAMVKWLPPHGFTGKVHHLDAKVGGTLQNVFTNLGSGHCHSFGGTYLELVPASGSSTPTNSTTRICPAKCGDDRIEKSVLRHRTEYRAGRHSGRHSDAACCLGWQESLTLLTQLVEPEIPG